MKPLEDLFTQSFGKIPLTPKEAKTLKALFSEVRKGGFSIEEDPKDPLFSPLIEKENSPLIRHQNRLYLRSAWELETNVVKHLQRLFQTTPPAYFSKETFSEILEKNSHLSPEQKKAIQAPFYSSLTLIAGGPGTGKTFTAACLVETLIESWDKKKKNRLKIALAAPTGKAALHLASVLTHKDPAVRIEASTLHRLLGLSLKKSDKPLQRYIDADLILIDEASMIDPSLFSQLLQRVPRHARLIFLGDPDQLPPVGSNTSFFGQLAPTLAHFLTQTHRTNRPQLTTLAKAIREGDLDSFFTALPPIHPLDETLFETLYAKAPPLIQKERPDPIEAMKAMQTSRILSALRKGPWGTDAINRKLFEWTQERCPPGHWWAVLILATANAPRLNLFNGSIGIFMGKKGDPEEPLNEQAFFPETGWIENPPPFEISFCLSIHKSQGSEFETVYALFPEGTENLGKAALYTAATRAKKGWRIFGNKQTLEETFKNTSRSGTELVERLIQTKT